MKKSQPVRELLGMNQHDMAMLVGVSRSHYAMFEIGQRDLPANATQILADMLVNVQVHTMVTKKNPLQAHINKEIYSKLEQLLRENEYQQLLIAKMIEQLIKKNDKQTKVATLVNYLKTQPQVVDEKSFALASISQKTTQNFSFMFEVDLATMQVEQELLTLERELLETKMKNIKLK